MQIRPLYDRVIVKRIETQRTTLEDKGNFGYNAATGEYGDLVEAGVVDPTKVTRTALQNAASIAGLILPTDATVRTRLDGGALEPETVSIPARIRELFATAFEIDPQWLVECAARRQKWIDQAQSLNIYMGGASGRQLDELYRLAWIRGLKTTYYLRTLGATHAEKSTTRAGQLNAVPNEAEVAGPRVCALKPGQAGYTDCEACQ